MAWRAPRLSASIPTAPVPAYASTKTQRSTRAPRILKRVWRILSGVGLVSSPGSDRSLRLRNSPAITRIGSAYLHQTITTLPVPPDVFDSLRIIGGRRRTFDE